MRQAAITLVLVGIVTVPVVLVAQGCRRSEERTHETVLTDAIACMGRLTREAASADDFDSSSRLVNSLRTGATRLRDLRREFVAMPAPSRWERSRIRPHRPLAESTLESWADAARDLRARAESNLPPHLRLALADALEGFESARVEAWVVMVDWN